MAHQHEGAGAVGVQGRVRRCRRVHGGGFGRAMLLRPFLREDAPSFPLVDEQRVRRLENEIDRGVVDLHYLGVERHAALDVRAGGADAIGREDDIVGGEILAIVEFHALAQMKAPMQRIERLPARREARLDLHVLAAPDQPFIDRPVDAEAEALVDRIGIDGLQFALESEAQGLGAGLGREEGSCDDRSGAQRSERELPSLFGQP
jgi:hypothetical protein